MKTGGYQIDVLVQGFPGKPVCRGGLGWSTIALVRNDAHAILVDVGAFGIRPVLIEELAAHGLEPGDVSDVILTHAHYDHSINWVTFPSARIFIGADELAWALEQPLGTTIVPELYVRELSACERLRRVQAGDAVLPGLTAHATPGHTPGHLIYVLSSGEYDVIFTGDAAKNRAELIGRKADLTLDAAASTASIDHIWDLWRRRPGSVVIPGHDVPMVLRDGRPQYIGERRAAIAAWFGDSIEETHVFELSLA